MNHSHSIIPFFSTIITSLSTFDMGKRGGKRRRRNGGTAPEETGRDDSPPRSLEVQLLEEGEDASETTAVAHPSQSSLDSIPSCLPASIMCQSTENVEIQRLQRCWYQVEQRKGKNGLLPTMIQLQTWSVLMPELVSEQSIVGDNSKPFPYRTVLGLAPTGSGKTLAYGLPLLLRTASWDRKGPGPKIFGLVLVPTRELASQVSRELKSAVVSSMGVRVLPVYGGIDKKEQKKSLLEGSLSGIVVATPGRLVDLMSPSNEEKGGTNIEQHRLTKIFSNVGSIVMDEADRLAINTDMARQVDRILEMLPPCTDRIMCLFSATLPERIRPLWAKWAPGRRLCIKVNLLSVGINEEAEGVEERKESAGTAYTFLDGATAQNQSTDRKRKHAGGALNLGQIPSHITQILHVCASHKKPRKLLTTLSSKIRGQEGNRRHKSLCLIFFAKIKTLQYVHKLLVKEGIKCTEFHSQMPQDERETALLNFRSGKIPTLLSTDIAARGIHCNNIEHVINYDFPATLEQYVHRCGRAGRYQIITSGGEDVPTSPATVYSFFTRNLAPMASDLIALLRASKAWVDPNLVQLINESPSTTASMKNASDGAAKRKKQTEDQVTDNKDESEVRKSFDSDDASDDDGQFRHLNPKRISLKRAAHVASDSSDDDEEQSTHD